MAILIPAVRPGLAGGGLQASRRRRLRTVHHGSIWMLLSCAIALGSLSDLQTQTPPEEYEVKAAFLYNFAKFVDWPPEAFPEAGSPLIIGVVGDDPFGDVLDRTVSGKLVQGRPLEIRRWRHLEYGPSCHILFVSDSGRRSQPEMLEKLRSVPVLTVGESKGFAEQGGMINFLLTDNKVRFEINDRSAKRAGLKVSSRLLALAIHVWE